MLTATCFADRHGLIRASAVDDSGVRSSLARHAEAGRLVRLARGVYLPMQTWEELDPSSRYRAVIRAAVGGKLQAGELVHGVSACALWRLPLLAPWPDSVHTVSPHRGGGKRSGQVIRHTTARPDRGTQLDGLPVTTLARTVAETAAKIEFSAGVAIADAAVRGTVTHRAGPGLAARPPAQLSDLLAEAAMIPIYHGRSRALRAVAFSDPRADSPGESLLRAALHRLGTPPPELQTAFTGSTGARYFVDFYWPEQSFVLEFDGREKYSEPALRGGRSAEQVVYDEKLREDDLRAQVQGFARVDWATASSPQRLATRLERAGFCW
jgi:hypothetical protein